MKSLAAASAAMLFCVLVASAQDATGRVIGTVTDASGAVVPGARIIVTNTATQVSRETTSDKDGYH